MADPLEQMPPQNLQAEEAVLGAMMMAERAAIAAYDEGLRAEHFYRPAHRVLHDAITAVQAGGMGMDELTVVSYLQTETVKDYRGEEQPALAAAGGAAYVLGLARSMPATSNVKAYAREVIDQAMKRRLVEAGHEIARLGYERRPVDAIAEAEALLLGMTSTAGARHQSGELVTSDASMDTWLTTYVRLQDGDAYEAETLSWGRGELDEAYGRLMRGGVYVPAGWTKHGKTWFVLDVAEAACEQGARTYIASGEMSADEIADRFVAMGGHNYTAVQEKRVPQSVLAKRIKQVREWPLSIATGRITIARLRADVARARLEGDPYRLVVLDHLHLLKPDRGAKWQPKNDFLDDACSELKALAEEFGFTLLLVCQLKKPDRQPGEHQAYKRPPAEDDLKGAAAIPQIATTVIFVYKMMDKEKGRFVERRAVLLSPWHRLRPQHPRIDVEFSVYTAMGVPAYRYVPRAVQEAKVAEAAAPAKAALEQTFGPVTLLTNTDDTIPF